VHLVGSIIRINHDARSPERHVNATWQHTDCIWITVSTKQYCQWNFSQKIWSAVKCWQDIYHWGACLAVTGRTRYSAKNVLQSPFQTGSSSSPHLQPHFLAYRIPRDW